MVQMSMFGEEPKKMKSVLADEIREALAAFKEVGNTFGLRQLSDWVMATRQARGEKWVLEDTVRKYARDFLRDEIPTEKVKNGLYRFSNPQ